MNICCQINTPAASKCNSAFKKHDELVKQIKQSNVNDVANVKKQPLSFVYGAAFAVFFYNPVILRDHGSSKIDFKTIKKIFSGLEKHAHTFSRELLYWHGTLHTPTSCRGKTKKRRTWWHYHSV